MRGEEVANEALGIGGEEVFDAAGGRGFEDETGVMVFRDAIYDLGIMIRGSVRAFLPSKRDERAGVVAAHCG